MLAFLFLKEYQKEQHLLRGTKRQIMQERGWKNRPLVVVKTKLFFIQIYIYQKSGNPSIICLSFRKLQFKNEYVGDAFDQPVIAEENFCLRCLLFLW